MLQRIRDIVVVITCLTFLLGMSIWLTIGFTDNKCAKEKRAMDIEKAYSKVGKKK